MSGKSEGFDESSSSAGSLLQPEERRFVQRLRAVETRYRASIDRILMNAGISELSDTSTVALLQDSVAKLDELIGDLASELDSSGPGVRLSRPAPHLEDVPVSDAVRYMKQLRTSMVRRIASLQRQEQMEEIKDAVEEKVVDPDIRRELSEMVERISQQQAELAAKVQAQDEIGVGEIKRLNIMKQRWEVRKAMLEREPAAVLVGAVLLILLAISLIVAMFIHTDVPEIVASGFLLILGFFFGQNSSRGGSSN